MLFFSLDFKLIDSSMNVQFVYMFYEYSMKHFSKSCEDPSSEI